MTEYSSNQPIKKEWTVLACFKDPGPRFLSS